ncbi:Potassium Voltage-Gated Channel Subfamily C Member 1 [Manis pentadactyla]|nr:Potassium Voltage-Gated Channel Subfamily C Member 1 [Manis pentadactyla]
MGRSSGFQFDNLPPRELLEVTLKLSKPLAGLGERLLHGPPGATENTHRAVLSSRPPTRLTWLSEREVTPRRLRKRAPAHQCTPHFLQGPCHG